MAATSDQLEWGVSRDNRGKCNYIAASRKALFPACKVRHDAQFIARQVIAFVSVQFRVRAGKIAGLRGSFERKKRVCTNARWVFFSVEFFVGSRLLSRLASASVQCRPSPSQRCARDVRLLMVKQDTVALVGVRLKMDPTSRWTWNTKRSFCFVSVSVYSREWRLWFSYRIKITDCTTAATASAAAVWCAVVSSCVHSLASDLRWRIPRHMP